MRWERLDLISFVVVAGIIVVVVEAVALRVVMVVVVVLVVTMEGTFSVINNKCYEAVVILRYMDKVFKSCEMLTVLTFAHPAPQISMLT